MAEGDVRETMFEFQAVRFLDKKNNINNINVEDEDVVSSTSESSMGEYTTSVNSQGSTSSSLDLVDDASSSSSTSISSSNNNNEGPLYELSQLMAHLPIKRGLSKFYEGKTQSFTSLSSVKSVEDLAKKESSILYPYRKCRRMKGCKSYGGGMDNNNKLYTPKPTISKKVSRRRSFPNGRPPLIPLQSNFSSI